MLTEKASLKQTQAQTQPQPQLQQAPTIVMVPTAVATSLPFNVQTDLNLYKKISIVKQYDYFRILHCCQNLIPDYIVYGEMPDGDKKILFLVVLILNVVDVVMSSLSGLDYVLMFVVIKYYFKWIINEME